MKKSFAIIALAALVMLAGCKKNDTKPNGTRLFAGIEKHKSDSKTSLDGLQIKWSENDQLYVNNDTTPACFTLVSGAGTTKGEFATEGEYPFAAENNVAVYPYNYVSGLDNTTVTMTLPAVQEASGAGTFGNGANPMLGTFSDMDNLTLTSLCGVLCLQLRGDNIAITAIEIVGGPDDKLNGTFTVDYMNPVLTYSANGTNTVRLNCNATLTSTAQKFYVVVPAGTLHGFTMKVYNGDNEIFSKSTTNDIPVYVNTLSTMDPVEVVTAPVGPLATPLTLEAQTDGDIVVIIGDVGGKGGGVYPGSSKGGPGGGGSGNANRKYSVNNGEKTLIPMGETTIPVNAGDKVQFYGNGTYGGDILVVLHGTAQTKVYGNIMSFVDETGYATLTTLQDLPGAFMGTFYMNANLTDASGLLLPATTLSNHCYGSMFAGCTSLTTAPALPATELIGGCYSGMFQGCESLTTAPTLPATTLASECYSYMFYGCTSLTTAPTLPAETLPVDCYSYMFQGCTSLTTAPALPATTLAEDCYAGMFAGCTSLTTAPALPAATLAAYCYYGMFSGCTSLTTAPALPVETLVSNCYRGMFRGCTSLTTAPTLPATTLAGSCYRQMFQNCSNLNNITCLATEGINENESTYNWVDGVASTGTFNRASGATWPTGVNGIPEGWTLVPPAVPTLDLATVTTATTVEDGYTLTGTLGANVKISIADGATVTLDGVTINGVNENSYDWAGITCLGDATIILSGTDTVKGFHSANPGIYVPKNKTLTIQGSGSLTASSNGYGCGIGSCNYKSCGNIVIAGGTINATGGQYTAGIGGGSESCGDISITGGTVTANGGGGGAGIGSGEGGSCGNISITGGTINATGGNQAAGIGGGSYGSCGNITITNGVTSVTATKGNSATHSIGEGNEGSCGTVTIGGTVYWDGSAYQNGGDTYLTQSPLVYEP